MRFQRHWLRSRVGRRILGLFVLAALIPTASLAWFTYQTLSDELSRDAERRLRMASKAAGLDLFARLNELDAELRVVEPYVSAGVSLPSLARCELGRYFDAVSAFGGGAGSRVLLGEPFALPEFEEGASLQWETGQPALTSEVAAEAVPQVFLGRRTERGALVVGRARLDVLIPSFHNKAIAFATNFCVFDGDGAPIGCSFPEGEGQPRSLAATSFDTGAFRWTIDDEVFFANGWELFLRAGFGVGEWTVVVVEPEEVVLAPLRAFRADYPLLAVLALAVASLLSLTQIRRQLDPLERLRDATERLSGDHLDPALEVRSGDEFEDLADSFNAMTRRLRTQFDSLQRLIQIDRVVLAEQDAQRVLEVAVSRVGELFPCEVAILVLELPDTVELLIKRSAGAITRSELPKTPGRRIGDWFNGGEPVAYTADSAALPYREQLSPIAVARWVVLPLAVDGRNEALMLLGTNAAEAEDQILFAQQLVDQSAVALENARTHEKNRALAYFDTLTALPNRLLLRERAGQAVLRAQRHGNRLAILLLDLDHFKRINDTAGHESGDWFLKRLARRIQRGAKSNTVARMGGDEFALLVQDIDSAETAA
ncbi:MAG: diguanylate cyclase domain-containing protein, partial [Myxococcota bacterium]